MTIGEKIKQLRKKNDLTQEKLADYLCVSYQAVSKWECGLSSPDISLIAPLTRLFHVSADELLCLTPEITDERKAYFDSEYHEFWKKEDPEADMEIARQAVAEYPGDFRYLYWLASNEQYVGYSVKYCGTEKEKELLESSVHHYLTILENCENIELRNNAISGLVHVHKIKGQLQEAKKYALMYPDRPETSRDDLLMLCVEGEEQELLLKKSVRDCLNNLCIALDHLWVLLPNPSEEILNARAAVIDAVITDKNYQKFYITLFLIYMEKARIAIRKEKYEKALFAITTAYDHAVNFDIMDRTKIESYSCPVLYGYTLDHTNDREKEWTLVEEIKRCLTEEQIFLPILNRQEISKIINS